MIRGMKKETEFVHRGYKYENGHQEWWILQRIQGADNPNYDEFPAPLASELLEELPECFSLHRIDCLPKPLFACYKNIDVEIQTRAENPCDALALMWLYLRKEKLI